jgi:N-acetylmuramoyl-L-alanine amidase
MNLKKCFLTKNNCYVAYKKMTGAKPTGIVVHSTGANNAYVKRYVQPLKTDKDYKTIIADLGVNQYSNDWNRATADVCVHAFMGKNAKGQIVTYQTLPFDICCWGVGAGKNGSYNYNPTARVQFEICEDGLTDKTYFDAVFKEAIEFCAYLCKTYGFGVDKISSHYESYKQGYGSNHGDCDHWLKKFGKDMNWFRAEVQKLLVEEKEEKKETTSPSVSTQKPTTNSNSTNKTNIISYKAGTKIQLSSTPLYISATATTAKSQKSGTYYIWSNEAINGRVRITNDASRVGKTGQVTGWIKVSDIKTATTATPKQTIKVGSTVKVKQGAKTYTGGNLYSFVYNRNHKVKEIKGDRVVITYLGVTVCAIKLSDLIFVK